MPRHDLGSFAKRIRVLGKQVEDNTNRIVKEVALVADRELVLGTPVDTGRARSNWIVGIGSSPSRTQEAHSPGVAGSTGAQNAAAAMAQAQAEIEGRQPGQDVYISNNLSYIGRLNDGYSAQAPSGFVQKAVLRAVQAIKNARLLK